MRRPTRLRPLISQENIDARAAVAEKAHTKELAGGSTPEVSAEEWRDSVDEAVTSARILDGNAQGTNCISLEVIAARSNASKAARAALLASDARVYSPREVAERQTERSIAARNLQLSQETK